MSRIPFPPLLVAVMLLSFLAIAQDKKAATPAPYKDWLHAGRLTILTTAAGADLPATASEEGFPLLVRVSKGTFDFAQAKAGGEDIRFSVAGQPLAFQIEEWNPAGGTASIWVRIPVIKGNAHQEIRLHWGKADASSESSGPAVFNASNGYLSVMHLSDPADPVKDDAGTLTPANAGTTAGAGMIGLGRHIDAGQGINCGESIANFPSGAGDSSTEAWIRAQETNTTALAWGGEQPQGKVVLESERPLHFKITSWFSGADVKSETVLPMAQWAHVVHTYRKGESRIYVNGHLDDVKTGGSPLAIPSPAGMWIGGWYGGKKLNLRFAGDIDEVRISKVVRSADWIRLEYENQKARQTLVGSLIQPGDHFSVTPAQITIDEGTSATFTAQAGGAEKVSWILQRNGEETIVATDQYTYTHDAGRVMGDASYVLQFKAVYADGVKTRDIPVTVKDVIPEPVVALTAPANWNGRETIEVVPTVTNLAELQAKGVAQLTRQWTVSGGAVIKEVKPDRLILKRSQYTGPISVKLAVNNGGPDGVATAAIQVTEPKNEPWVQRTPGKDEKPEDNQFYARDDKNEGTLYYDGSTSEAGQAVFLKLYADDRLITTERQTTKADKSYAFAVKLHPGLITYKVEFGTKTGDAETVLHTATNLVCGDAYIIQGQSNAVAYNYSKTTPEFAQTPSPWLRTYGGNGEASNPIQGGWGNAVVNKMTPTSPDRVHFVGVWGYALARRLMENHQMPICIINGAVGGTRIDEHLRNEDNPRDPKTIYGRMLARIESAKLTHGIRAVLWHQGEADQGTLGPTGDYDWKTYQQYFVDLSAAWKQDYPNLRYYYIYQIWPNACTDPSANDMLRETQRTLPYLFSNMRIMTTLGIVPGSSCHYQPAGYQKFADLMGPLVEQDNYGVVPDAAITAPDLRRASFTSVAHNAILLEFGQDMAWNGGSAGLFFLDGVAGKVATGSASGKTIRLQLQEASKARTITYLVGKAPWDQKNLVYGANGIAGLTFCNVPISDAEPAR